MTGPVAGVWVVTAPDAPFPHHVFTFHADGTMAQSNPEGGNPSTGDSTGMGLWRAVGPLVTGRFVEVGAWRETRSFAGATVVAFEVTVVGDFFRGHATTRRTDESGRLTPGTATTALTGRRFTFDGEDPLPP